MIGTWRGVGGHLVHYGGAQRSWASSQDFHPKLVPMASGPQESVVGSHLVAPVLANELGGHMRREHVLQKQPSQVLHCLCLLPLLPQLLLPQEVQATIILILGRVTRGPWGDTVQGDPQLLSVQPHSTMLKPIPPCSLEIRLKVQLSLGRLPCN